MEAEKKICFKCKKEKCLSEFGKDKYNNDGYTYDCKICRREKEQIWRDKNRDKIKEINEKRTENRKAYYKSDVGVISSRRAHLKRSFNITLEEYDELLDKQNQVCGICGSNETDKRNMFLSVDHNHDTNKIRGLLCNTCNRALGLFKDDKNNLLNAIKYLENHEF